MFEVAVAALSFFIGRCVGVEQPQGFFIHGGLQHIILTATFMFALFD